MKFLTTIFGTLLFFAMTAGMEASAQSITTYGWVKDNYSIRDLAITACDDPVVQGGITASWENGFYADFWASEASNESCDEQDYTIGYTGEAGGLNVHLQAAHYVIPAAPDNIFRVRLELSDAYEVDGSNTVGWMIGIDRLDGLLEITNPRANVSWAHDFGSSWASTLTAGAAYRDDIDTVSSYGEVALARTFDSWTLTGSISSFVAPNNDHTTFGLGFSRSF